MSNADTHIFACLHEGAVVMLLLVIACEHQFYCG